MTSRRPDTSWHQRLLLGAVLFSPRQALSSRRGLLNRRRTPEQRISTFCIESVDRQAAKFFHAIGPSLHSEPSCFSIALFYNRRMKGKELVRRLRRAGVEITGRSGGTGHLLARFQGRKAPVPMHGDRDLGPDFIKKLCKQLGLDPLRVL